MTDQSLQFETKPEVPTVDDLVGEGKKYATLEDAVNSIPHAQNHIAKVEAEAAELRAELEKRTSVEEQLKALSGSPDSNGAAQQPAVEAQAEVTSLGEGDVLSIIQQYEAGKSAEANVTKVTATLSGVYGDKAEATFTAKAAELGMSVEDLSALARKSPKAVLAYFDIKEAKAPTKTQGSFNTESLNQSQQPKERRSVMSGAKTTEVRALWDAIKDDVINGR